MQNFSRVGSQDPISPRPLHSQHPATSRKEEEGNCLIAPIIPSLISFLDNVIQTWLLSFSVSSMRLCLSLTLYKLIFPSHTANVRIWSWNREMFNLSLSDLHLRLLGKIHINGNLSRLFFYQECKSKGLSKLLPRSTLGSPSENLSGAGVNHLSHFNKWRHLIKEVWDTRTKNSTSLWTLHTTCFT